MGSPYIESGKSKSQVNIVAGWLFEGR